MLPRINPTTTTAWQLLKEHYAEMKKVHLKDLFKEDNNRFKKYTLYLPDIIWDYSKNIITDKTLDILLQLAEECDLKSAIDSMFIGDKINETENRAVLHTALRNYSEKSVLVDGEDVMVKVHDVLNQMKDFCSRIHSGEWIGFTGKKIKYIVNVGIGGSDLGPVMVTEALRPYWIEDIQTYFVSNIDGSHLAETLKKVNPEETIFLIASKTFTTQETMTNAYSAREWFLKTALDESQVAKHFVALSTNKSEVENFGIDSKNMF
ncbi:MAG: glucose-6-phosphate isomerase, partial [Ginsengibacter sp.]